MEKKDKNPMTEMEQLAATITEGTKTTLKDILSEAVSNYLHEEVLNEDDDETEDAEETSDNETSDVEEFAETSDEASDDAEEDLENEDDVDETETDGDEWADFDDYKIGDDEGSEEYDFTNETDPDTLVKVFKLMKNDDQVSVVKDGDKVSVKDNEAGTEYVIELNCDSSDNNEEFNGEMTMESLGYTDNYQDKDPIEGLSMDDAPANTKDWHKGVPTGTKKPWAGKGSSEPFGKKSEKVFEITLNDAVDTEEEDDFIEENATTSKYQQRRMTKTMVPDNAYVQDGSHEVSQGGKLKVESLQRKVNAALRENKQLKETVAKVSKIMKEAVQVNVNLGHIVRLMVENTTTKTEKEDIVKRFNNVKTNEEAKSLYESISSELKKTHSTIMTEQATTTEGSKKINESKIYDEPNGVLDMMKRMNMI
jgi:hypothetical protein